MNTPLHPIQCRDHKPGRVSAAVTARAYEVYAHLFGQQQLIADLNSRGGFGSAEMVALLYARSWPREEWSARFTEGLQGSSL